MINYRRSKDDPSLPGKPYLPSSGLEGCAILNGLCSTCARDKVMREGVPIEECDDDETCEIIADSFLGAEVVEWRELENGNILCVAYVEVVTESVRDDRTIDMFEEAE